ncbi:DNA topoisomerase IV subunit A [Aerococcaceae bacterium zg-ZUI334]|uniref:DNA topoisomerase IV subunit A n=1 Tax=Aerococcaceae TaxID=186827 RepID=UPI0013B5D87B|nr:MULTISPECIES: DNA topoisomerase IV subunit A [unclassified Facklamia]MBR7928301.1 DNA topoisomerase IV subunit A [Aerococcaceae bacterium zg-ZUI334]MBS4461102.1 DNA topoisomerase IV subunit A [Aerococcaceae bacterium zg-B36]QQD64869.1 DNA topoisomerase IV subunit A [Aerococcaceae bacterium zg-252]NEW64409.1 DNA topoisomerase IV subunit A [Facklamia sp. 252]NEW68490.1 DNA topoisomerase IV subunit A [Facklamia sp. 253]
MVQENIQELNFANVIGDRFGRYSKYIIQDRALPDIRDGLKPVQRRILYAMYMDRNTAANPYRKSAKTVGNVIGNYHPHGDSSVYEAMVRMSQDWKLRETLIDMHGNNGSMDGDPAAAMRYTEARLSPIADELLRDIQHQTVDYLLNFDDTLEEPTVLPARIPNLLVNGATGISAGYATEIPPHNLAEVIDALVYMLSHKRYQLSDILQFVQAPDFPTGAIIQGADQIRKAYETGQGKIIVRSVTEIEQLKGNKQQIVIHELPYEVNKAKLIQRLDDIRIQRKIEGIADVRDESDRNGVRVVIELKREVNAEGILQYLLKNTDLQVNYHFNMVAIHERRPMVVGLMQMLEAYLAHQKEVLTKRTEHMLAADKKRLHIVDGLIRVVSILDEVIALIRASENKADAKRNLEREFEFSPEQSESIVNLQLYRLTNTDIEALQNEKLELNERILMYQNILNNEETLKKVLANELKDIKKRYQTPRRTRVQAEVEEITVETSILIPDEQVYVSVTKEGYIKRTSVRSFTASDAQDLGSRELDYPIFVQEMSTHDAIVLVTNKGNYIHLPVHELPDIRWKDMGMHLSTNYRLEDGEQLIAAFKSVMDASTLSGDDNPTLVMTTRKGMIKQTTLDQFTTYRSYKTKTATAMKLKDDQDAVITVAKAKPDVTYEVIVITERSYGVRYDLSGVPVSGMKAQGVVAIKLKDDDKVVASLLIDTAIERPQLLALTQRAHLKRFDVEVVAKVSNRSSRGHLLLKELKANPHRFIQVIALTKGNIPIVVLGDTGKTLEVKAFDTPISDRLSNGSLLHDAELLGQVISLYPARLKMLDEE